MVYNVRMDTLRELTIIFAVSFLGEAAHSLIPLPIPASIYGLVIMVVALVSGVVPLRSVERTGRLFLRVMPVAFVPAGVGLLGVWDSVAPKLGSLLIVMIVPSLVVAIVSGRVCQYVMRRRRG